MATLLVVDDDQRNQRYVRSALELDGHRVQVVRSAEDALDLLGRQAIDAVLLDMQLPGLDGLQAMALLRADPRTAALPVVAMTASVLPEKRREVMAAGFCAFLAKPFMPDELAAAVREALGTE
jgi:CheY-like chemotaxis protein